MELGIMLNVYRHHRGEKMCRPFSEQLRDSYDAGFRVVDLNTCASVRGVGDQMADDSWESITHSLGEEAARLGVRFAQAHAPFNGNFYIRGKRPTPEYEALFREMSLRTVKAAGMLGIPWVVIHPLTDTVNTEYDPEIQIRTNIEFYSEMLEEAHKAGTGLAIENMAEFSRDGFTRRFCAATDELVALIDAFGDSAVGACWDFGHGRELYADQPRQLRKLGARLKATHVHDNKGERDSHLIPFVGGNISWETIMPALREMGYGGDFVLESHMFMQYVPDALRPAAGRLMHEFGEYCMQLYRA